MGSSFSPRGAGGGYRRRSLAMAVTVAVQAALWIGGTMFLMRRDPGITQRRWARPTDPLATAAAA